MNRQDLHKPSKLKEICATHGLSPSKQYGQHYLISDAPVKKMIVVADVKKEDTIVEIGPGLGILTTALAQTGANIIAFEIEQKLKSYWGGMKKELPNVEFIWGNVMYQFQKRIESVTQPYKVVANLPYQITSQVLRLLLESTHPPLQIVVMVQREVADRMCAKAGNMNLLGLSVQYYGKPHIVAKVARGSFWPVPGVDSSVVSIQDIVQVGQRNKQEADLLFFLAKKAFQNKRKQLWRALVDAYCLTANQAKKFLIEVAENDRIRPQDLSSNQWIDLVRAF